MPKQFPQETVADALERSLRNAKHLRAKDAATVAAARALAWKIDHWDELAEQAISDAEAKGRYPSGCAAERQYLAADVPGNIARRLGLVPEEEKPAKPARGKAAKPEATPVADELEEYLAKIS